MYLHDSTHGKMILLGSITLHFLTSKWSRNSLQLNSTLNVSLFILLSCKTVEALYLFLQPHVCLDIVFVAEFNM